MFDIFVITFLTFEAFPDLCLYNNFSLFQFIEHIGKNSSVTLKHSIAVTIEKWSDEK